MATGDFLLRRLPPEDVKLTDEEARRFYILKIKIMQNFYFAEYHRQCAEYQGGDEEAFDDELLREQESARECERARESARERERARERE